MNPYRSGLKPGRDGFPRLLHAEWTKFRTVRGWVLGLLASALVVVLLGLLSAAGSHSSCMRGNVEVACPTPPLGPGGQVVQDKFFFVHRPLTGDGSLTVRVTSLNGIITYPPPDHDKIVPGVVPWAKAGILLKESTRQGSPYAAVMVTGGHGTRMQHDYTGDRAGRPGRVSASAPRWLRLVRSGDRLTGYESADGSRWTEIDTVRLPGLPETVRIGLFATSPGDLTVKQNSLGGSIEQVRLTEATAVFDDVALQGRTGGAWNGEDIGAVEGDGPGGIHHPGSVKESDGTFTVRGNGDIAPSSEGVRPEQTLSGLTVGMLGVIVVAALFITAEYRRGLIRTTLLASPRRGRALAAKAAVIGAVTFVTGLAACALAFTAGERVLRENGNFLHPVPALTEVRIVVGAAVVLAVSAVLALALGSLLRRGSLAVIAGAVLLVVPYLLATVSLLPADASEWLLRLTPAAALATLQSVTEHHQVIENHTPQNGYYPLPPWAGLAVLCCYAALALGLAARRLRRRDA